MFRKLERWPLAVLESSIRRVGALTPRLVFQEKVLDGKRRFAICERLGLEISTLHAESEQEAAIALYAVEPKRCVQLFGAGGIVSLALLLAVRPGQIAHHYPRQRSPVANRNARKLRKLQVYLEQVEQGLVTVDTVKLKRLLEKDT